MPKEPKNIANWLTNFCDSLRIFVSIVVIQIAVVIYAFSFLSFDLEFLRKLSILSLLAQLTGIVILVILCKMGNFFNRFEVKLGVFLLIVLLMIITVFLTQIIGYLDLQLAFNLFENKDSVNYINIKLSVSTVIICLALLRYFYVQDQYNQQIENLSNARLNALQARIKPHFLFNSLNSIASLISIDADKAELAISDFSNLMRRTFTYNDKTISIQEELTWVKQYLAIEKLRLDKRLSFEIVCDDSLFIYKIPVLCLQPLVENAIIHGIQPMEHGGTIKINIIIDSKQLIIKVSNPHIEKSKQTSNGMALMNIRERLQLHYGSKAYLKIVDSDGIFKVKVGLPL